MFNLLFMLELHNKELNTFNLGPAVISCADEGFYPPPFGWKSGCYEGEVSLAAMLVC